MKGSARRPPIGTPHGQHLPRGLDAVPRSRSYAGRFGRMFRHLPALESDQADLVRLGKSMIDTGGDEEDPNHPSNNPELPAGFTYLGQFIDHDLTFDPSSTLVRRNDPDALENFRTPRFDLDSLYGAGPADSPFLYQGDGMSFVIGENDAREEDLPRNEAERALIGDPRNDENLIVSQLHLAFLKYHNEVVKDLGPGRAAFEAAREIVRWHYQWIVLHDFLPRIVGPGVIDDRPGVIDDRPRVILTKKEYRLLGAGDHRGVTWKADLEFFHWKHTPFMPVEFSVAAYRFGHSLIRTDYALDRDSADEEIKLFDPAQNDRPEPNDLRGFRKRPPRRRIEWSRFFEFPGRDKARGLPQVTRAFDTRLAQALGTLPPAVGPTRGGPPGIDPADLGSLAVRNLLRGWQLGLPSGQAVARAMGLPRELVIGEGTPFSIELPEGMEKSAAIAHLEEKFRAATPLWYYILKEAEIFGKGRTLGPIGGRIVAEVFIGLMFGDTSSYLHVDPKWEPRKGEHGAKEHGRFGIVDLLEHAQVSV